MTQLPVLLTTGQVAAQFGVSDEAVRRWAAKGLINAIVLPSGRRRFRAEDIARFLEPTPVAEDVPA